MSLKAIALRLHRCSCELYVPNLLSGQPQTHPQAQDGGVVSIVRTDTNGP
jgi:hypothetical protein